MKTRKEIMQRINELSEGKEDRGNNANYKINRQVNILDWAVGKYESEVLDRIEYIKEQKKRVTTSQGRNLYNKEFSELLWVLDY